MIKEHFLIIAVLAIGVLVIPSVYAIFSGEHYFYDNSQTGCLKCHSDIKEEIASSAIHNDLTCENCHINPGLSNGTTHSNVIVPKCIDCHSLGKNINNDSHAPFILGANTSNLMNGNNEACISCHTEKPLDFQMSLDDTYKLDAVRSNSVIARSASTQSESGAIASEWQVSNYSDFMINNNPQNIKYAGSGNDHTFSSLANLKCDKCHSSEQKVLNNSNIHTTLSCDSCHQLNPGFHAANIPSCLNCHSYDVNNQADAHTPFVKSANITNYDGTNNGACSLCHSNFNKEITYTRPSFFEYDIVNSSGKWLIENLVYGQPKDVDTSNNFNNGNIHATSLEDNCIVCHSDIKDAVIAGGHSNEQWKDKHNYAGYTDMNSYCKSCHMPTTEQGGQSPYPAFPFNSNAHGSIKISCLDCHTKQDLQANINGNMVSAPYNSNVMGNIEDSIAQQPYFVQSYLCIACKNVGSPTVNNSIHFKIFTEPDVKVQYNITQIVSISTPTVTATPNITAVPNATSTPNVTETITPNITEIPTPTEPPNVTEIPNVTETVIPTPTPNVTEIPNVTETVTPNVTEIPNVTETVIPTPTETFNVTETVTPIPVVPVENIAVS